jgi:glutathione reductase (NADPH)
MEREYDLVVIGAGTAAMGVATRVRAAGWTVAVVDFRPFGGTCALRGCDPKKMLIGGTSAIDHVRRMHGQGVAGEVRIDWPRLMAFKRTFTDPVPELQEQSYRKKGIDTFHAKARFTGPNTLEIAGETVGAKHVVLASGAEPVRLNIPGEEHLATNEEFLQLESLPPRIVLVGGGYIAAEFSHIAALAGSKVTVLQHGDRMLKNFDADLVGWLMEKFEALRIDVRAKTSAERIEKTDGGFRVWASKDGEQVRIDADLVVHAAGRAPAFDALNLIFSPGLSAPMSTSTGAPAALARSDGWKLLTKGTAANPAPTAPAQVEAISHVRLLASTGMLLIRKPLEQVFCVSQRKGVEKLAAERALRRRQALTR